MSPVKSTYNFVPAPEEHEVFIPSWADQVSHDIPFEDGESGEIEIEITAETPIFIRNGYAKGKEDNEFSNETINGEKKYFIPATSLKGMTRNVLEIMSFSRLNKKLVNDDRYAFRDLTRESEYMKSYDSNKVCAGWLKEDENGNWTIEECKFNHIHHRDVDEALKTNFRALFLEKQPKEKTAFSKYKICGDKTLVSKFSIKQSKSKSKGIAVFDPNGKEGTIVFTGQSGPRKEKDKKIPSGKVHEFVFFDGIIEKFEIDENQKKGFKFVYLDHDSNNISPDWKAWKQKLEKGEKVPVFFNKEGKVIKHFGLAYMYKLPYKYSVHEMLPMAEYKESLDLATTIFGCTNNPQSLKGRVFFSDAISNNARLTSEQTDILGGPKASFTPFYLEQNDAKKVKTYQEKISLKGFKKYPVHQEVKQRTYTEEQKKNQKVFSTYKPVDKGAVFKGKIRYHNLKALELGALISALSFHATDDKLYHSLGGAKSLGFGRVKIEVKNLNNFMNELQVFEYQMNVHCLQKLKKNWLESKQLRELESMSKPASNHSAQLLVYPSIGKDGKNGTDDNEFIQIKKNKNFLKSYSTYNPSVDLKSHINDEIIKNWEIERKQLEEIKKREKAEIENKIQLLKNEANLKLENFDFEGANDSYKRAMELRNDGSIKDFTIKIQLRKCDFLKNAANDKLSSNHFDEALELYRQAMEIYDDGSLARFEEEVRKQKAKQEEELAFAALGEMKDIQALENFINSYPGSNFKEQIEEKLRTLKALSGIPETVSNKDNFKQFADNTDNWVNKLAKENLTIESAGFLEEHIQLLLKIAPAEFADKKRVKDFIENKVLKRITPWYSESKSKEIWQKINALRPV